MFFHKKLGIVFVVYLGFFLITNIVFGIIYWKISIVNNIPSPNPNFCEQAEWYNWVIFAIMNFFSTVDYDYTPLSIRNIVVIQHSINILINPLISGVIFYYILNRPAHIIFPKQVLLRRRLDPQIQGNKQLTLSIKIGNKSRKKIYNITCQIIFAFFRKGYSDRYYRVTDTYFTENIPFVDKTYRFSFEVTQFPKHLIKALLEQGDIHQNFSLTFVIQGKHGEFGETFMTERQYNLKDIVIAKDSKPLYNYSENENGKLVRGKTNWKNLDIIVPYNEQERAEVIQKLNSLLGNDRNNTPN